MAGPAIASGAAILTANADGLKAGLTKAEGQLKGWGGRVRSSLGSMFAKGLGFAAGAFSFTALVGGAKRLLGEFTEVGESIDRISKSSRRLGTSTEFLSGLEHGAELSGVSMDELDTGLLRFRRQVEGPLDEALLAFAHRFEQTRDAGERNRMLFEAFGRSGQKLGNLFEGGAEGIRAFVAENERLGKSFTTEQGKAVEAANDAVTNAKKAFGGMFQGLLIGLAPVIQKFSEFATKVFQFLRPVFEWLTRAYDRYFTIAVAVWEAIGEAVVEVADNLAGMFDWVVELPSIQEVITAAFRGIGTAAAYAWDVVKIGAGAVVFAIGHVIGALSGVVEAFKENIRVVVDFVRQLPNWVKATIPIAGVIASIDADKLGADMKRASEGMIAWGKSAMDTPIGKSAAEFNTWLDRIINVGRGLRGVGKAFGETLGEGMVEGAAEAFEPVKLAGALVQGSKEAYSLIVTNQLRDLRTRATDPNVRELKKGNELHKKNNKKLGDIDKRLKELEAI